MPHLTSTIEHYDVNAKTIYLAIWPLRGSISENVSVPKFHAFIKM